MWTIPGRFWWSANAEKRRSMDANRYRVVREQMRRAGISWSLHEGHSIFGLDQWQYELNSTRELEGEKRFYGKCNYVYIYLIIYINDLQCLCETVVYGILYYTSYYILIDTFRDGYYNIMEYTWCFRPTRYFKRKQNILTFQNIINVVHRAVNNIHRTDDAYGALCNSKDIIFNIYYLFIET